MPLAKSTSSEGLGVKKTWWKTALKYGIGFALLAYVVWSNWEPKEGSGGLGLKDVFRPDREKHWGWYALAALFASISVGLTFIRWYFLVRAQDLPFTLRDAFRLGLVGNFFNIFLPGSVGGDLVKAAFIAREHERRTVAVSTVLIDRGVGLWGLIALPAVAGSLIWLFNPSILREQPFLLRTVQAALTILATTLGVWSLLGVLPERRAQRFAQRLNWIPKAGPVLAEFWRAVWLYRRRRLVILGTLALSVVNHMINVLAVYCSAKTFQTAAPIPPLAAHLIFVPWGLAFRGLVPLPGGVGVGEIVLGGLYKLLGYPKDIGILASFGQLVINWTLGISGYIAYLRMKRDVTKPNPPESA
jgi:uncharacterized protein (TIRG00374 family)